MEYKNKLKEYRIQSGLTYKALAKKCGLHISQILSIQGMDASRLSGVTLGVAIKIYRATKVDLFADVYDAVLSAEREAKE